MLMPSIFGENMLDGFFSDFYKPAHRRAPHMGLPVSSAVMKTDVRETEKGYELEIDLPGYAKEDVQAKLEDGYLTVSATTSRSEEKKDEDGTYIRRERYTGSCSRSFYVGDDVRQEDIKAKFENGILRLDVPKKEVLPEPEEHRIIPIE